MSGLSERFIDDVLTFYAVTTRFDTGVATDADAVPAYRIYEEETTTPLLTGNMALLDSANTAGLYSEQVTLSAANGFEVGKCYAIHKAATVNSVAGAAVESFVVRKKPLTPTTEGRELDVTAAGEAGLDLANMSALPAGGVPAFGIVDNGTAQSIPDTTHLQLRAGLTVGDDVLVGATLYIVSATTGAGQRALITDFVSATDTAAFDALPVALTGTVVYVVFATPPASTSLLPAVTVTTNNDKTGYALSATGSAALTEGYPADGATGTLPQLLYLLLAHLQEKSVSSTTVTLKKLDGSTTAATLTLDSATNPTSVTRSG